MAKKIERNEYKGSMDHAHFFDIYVRLHVSLYALLFFFPFFASYLLLTVLKMFIFIAMLFKDLPRFSAKDNKYIFLHQE